MNKLLKFLLFLFLTCQAYSCGNKSQQKIIDVPEDAIKSKIGFSKRINDFGLVSNETILIADFFIRNLGNTNLIIKEIQPECSCTGFTLDNDTILPGDSTKLLVNFNTKDKGLGLQRKVISIISNSEKEYNSLFIKCVIKEK